MANKWTQTEVYELRRLHHIGRTDGQIGHFLNRDKQSVARKRQSLGLKQSPFSTALRHCASRKKEGKSEWAALQNIEAFMKGQL